MGEDRDRIEAYLRWREESTSTRVEPSPFGTALFNDDFPLFMDGNLLRVERPFDATAAPLIAETDRLYDGFAHRGIIVPDDAAGSRLAATLEREGWEVDRLIFIAHRREADRESDLEVRSAASTRSIC